MNAWRPRLMLAMAALMLAVFVVACSGEDTPDPDATPTSTPALSATPALPTAILTGTPILPSAFYFNHPEGELIWKGPDDSVSSIPRAHCEPPSDVLLQYGIPARIEIAGERGFWYAGPTSPQATWSLTEYHHNNWQISRGPSQESIYLINPGEPGLAFECRDYGCF